MATRKDARGEATRIMSRAKHPLTAAEVNEKLGRQETSVPSTRELLTRLGMESRLLTVSPGRGRAPLAFADSPEKLAMPHPVEGLTDSSNGAAAPAHPAARKSARKTARKTTRRTAQHPARVATATATATSNGVAKYSATPYHSPAGKAIVAGPDGTLYALHPLVESH